MFYIYYFFIRKDSLYEKQSCGFIRANIEGMSHDELSQLVEIPPKQRWAISHFPAFVH